MDTSTVKKIVAELEERFPGKNIICITPEESGEVKEIICELRVSEDKSSSEAIAVIEESKPHLHRLTKEIYTVERGKLILNINGSACILEKGNCFTIVQGQVHFGLKGREDCPWVRVKSQPPWRSNDYYPYCKA